MRFDKLLDLSLLTIELKGLIWEADSYFLSFMSETSDFMNKPSSF
jgi:hypothetical protein